MAKQVPSVVIVGRTNVGKSTLFNRLSVNIKSITFDQAGVTRDFLTDVISWQGKSFELIDTGGVSLRKTTDPLLQKSRQQALDCIEMADLVLFVVDGAVGIVPEDREIARLLHKSGKKIILVVNKADAKTAKEHTHEFERLGFEMQQQVSAIHGTAIGDLLETIVQSLPEKGMKEVEQEPRFRVVLLGKPNVGKSSLMNLLLQEERSIVADMPGTTREAISEPVRFYQEDILVTDTPGIRRKRGVTEDLETLMVKSSLRALENTDIVLLLVDASEGKMADQELKLAFYAFEKQFKAVVLLFNKMDLVDDITKADLAFNLDIYRHFIKKIVMLNISCKTGENVGKILPLVEKVYQRYSQKFSDDELTLLFKEALMHRPLYKQEQRLIVKNVRQIKTAPITIVMTVNEPKWFGPSQLGYFENVMRRKYDLKGVPIRFLTKKRS